MNIQKEWRAKLESAYSLMVHYSKNIVCMYLENQSRLYATGKLGKLARGQLRHFFDMGELKILFLPLPSTVSNQNMLLNNSFPVHNYRISANGFRGNYSFLNLTLCTVTFDHSTYRCGNYSREETIQGRKLFVEIGYINVLSALTWQASLNSSLDGQIQVDLVKNTNFQVILPHRMGFNAIGAI